MIKIFHLKTNSQDIEYWVATNDNQVVGHIFMKIENDNRIKFLDAWVDENYRRKGI